MPSPAPVVEPAIVMQQINVATDEAAAQEESGAKERQKQQLEFQLQEQEFYQQQLRQQQQVLQQQLPQPQQLLAQQKQTAQRNGGGCYVRHRDCRLHFAARFTRLQAELSKLAMDLTPSAQEFANKRAILDLLQTLVRRAWPDVCMLDIVLELMSLCRRRSKRTAHQRVRLRFPTRILTSA